MTVPGPLILTVDAWYLIVRAAEAREGYQDIESARQERRGEYEPIAQFDQTTRQHQQQTGVVDGPSYAEVVAGSSSQPNNNKTGPSDQPPSYSAIVKGGPFLRINRILAVGLAANGRS